MSITDAIRPCDAVTPEVLLTETQASRERERSVGVACLGWYHPPWEDKSMSVAEPLRLLDIAHGRSGDKGDHANIAVIAYTEAGYAWLRQHLTSEAVADYFRHLGPTSVVRYEAPNLRGLNFVLHNVLGGGASTSLRTDTQGKTFALALLQMPLQRLENFTAMLRPLPRDDA